MTEEDIMDRIRPMWTKQDQSGLNRIKVDQIRPKWTEND